MTPAFKKATGAVFSALLITSLGGALTAEPAPRAERTVYVTILGPQGPVTGGVTPADLKVLEDNVEREITSVVPAEGPVSTVLLLDTTRAASNVILDLRKAAIDYATVLLNMNPESRVAIAGFGGVAMITQPFTSSLDEITAATTKLVANTDGGAVMNEGFVAVSEELAKEESLRRFIITINMEPTDEYSQIRLEQVAEAVRDSGATVYAIQIQEGTRRDASRDQLLEALTTNSGGLRRSIQSPTALKDLLGSIASLNTAQWAVTFTHPDGEAAPKQTEIQVGHEGFRALSNMWTVR